MISGCTPHKEVNLSLGRSDIGSLYFIWIQTHNLHNTWWVYWFLPSVRSFMFIFEQVLQNIRYKHSLSKAIKLGFCSYFFISNQKKKRKENEWGETNKGKKNKAKAIKLKATLTCLAGAWVHMHQLFLFFFNIVSPTHTKKKSSSSRTPTFSYFLTLSHCINLTKIDKTKIPFGMILG